MKEFTLTNKKNIKLNILEGSELYEVNSIIIHIHGLGAHFQPLYHCIDEFTERDKFFIQQNFKSYALEFHGHGRSEGIRCCINSFEDLLDDLDILLSFVEIKHIDKPIYLFCESMGAAVALKYCITRENSIKGLIFLAPLFGIDDKLKPNGCLMGILLNIAFHFPQWKLLKTDSLITTNTEFLKEKKKNKYTYQDYHRLCTGRELFFVAEWIKNNIHLLKIPILIFHGLKDTTTQPEITRNLFELITVPNKELHLIEEAYHCLLIECSENPIVPKFIMNKTLDWIEKL